MNFDDDHFQSCCDFLTVLKSTEMILIATSDAAAALPLDSRCSSNISVALTLACGLTEASSSLTSKAT